MMLAGEFTGKTFVKDPAAYNYSMVCQDIPNPMTEGRNFTSMMYESRECFCYRAFQYFRGLECNLSGNQSWYLPKFAN